MFNFDVRQLEYFVMAARLGSYSKAAHELFVTPQAVSHSVQLLEARVGDKLFRRVSNGVALTEFGEAFLEEAQAVIGALERLQALVERNQGSGRAGVTLGIHPLCFEENGGTLNRNELLSFQKEQGPSSFAFIELSGSTIVDALVKGTVDVGISVPPQAADSELDREPLKLFPIAAIVSRSFPGHFAPSDERVSVEELSHGELVLFTNEVDYNDCLLEQARREGRELPVSPLQVHAHGDMGFLASSDLYVVRPLQHALRTVHDERLRVVPIVDAAGQTIDMPLSILVKKGHACTPAEERFRAFVRQRYRAARAE